MRRAVPGPRQRQRPRRDLADPLAARQVVFRHLGAPRHRLIDRPRQHRPVDERQPQSLCNGAANVLAVGAQLLTDGDPIEVIP